MIPISEQTTLIGFYGFKGGLGRTLATVHMAHFYSRMGKRVLLVDADIEAPGLSFWNLPRTSDSEDGLVQLLVKLGEEAMSPESLSSYVRASEDFFSWEIAHHPEAMVGCAPVHLMPTGLGSSPDSLDRYIQQLAEAQSSLRKQTDVLKDLFERSGYDIVLIDSRTGLNQIPAAIVSHLVRHQVLVTGPTRQAHRGLLTSLEMFTDEQLQRSVFAMSPMPWMASEQLARARTAISERLGKEGLAVRVLPIRWHPQLALDEHLITVYDPTSETGRDYQQLFVELESVRGFGIERYTESVDALLNLLKVTLDPKAGVAKVIEEGQSRHGDEVEDEFLLAFPEASDRHRKALTKFLELGEPNWTNQTLAMRSGFASLLVWEIVRRLRELALLDRESALSLWGIVVRRNQWGRYKDPWKDKGVDDSALDVLGRLYEEYKNQFGEGLSGLEPETEEVRPFVPEVTLDGFAAASGGLT